MELSVSSGVRLGAHFMLATMRVANCLKLCDVWRRKHTAAAFPMWVRQVHFPDETKEHARSTGAESCPLHITCFWDILGFHLEFVAFGLPGRWLPNGWSGLEVRCLGRAGRLGRGVRTSGCCMESRWP